MQRFVRAFNMRKSNFWHIIKWFFLSTFIGIVVGVLDAVFLKSLDASIAWRNGIPLYYFGLPIFLYIIALLARRVYRREIDYSTDSVIGRINAYQPIGFISILKSFVLSIVTMTVGGSMGKEAPCADTGAGTASLFARLFRMNPEDQRKMMICGVSAGFAGVFGVPISGAMFGLEVLWVGHIFYEVMFPAFIAGITAFQVTTYLGVNYVYHPLNFSPVFSEQFFLKVVVAAMFFGIISILFIEVMKMMRIIFRYITLRTSMFWRCFLGGFILVLIGFFLSPLYLGLGMHGIDSVLAGVAPESPFGFIIKMFTTAITAAAGGVGGIVTPIFFVGAQAGAMLSDFLGVDSATLAALGLVSVLAGAAKTPLSASIMAIELFGAEIAPYAAVACVISFLITGQQSVYSNQRVALDGDRADEIAPHPQTHLKTTRRIPNRKVMAKKVLREMVKHLIPKREDLDK